MENKSIFIFEIPARRRTMKRERTVKKTPAKPAQRYVKPLCLRVFENEYNAHHYTGRMANIPVECRAMYRFSDKTANDLTKAIVAWLNSHGAFGARVNTTGVFDAAAQRYRYSGATNGMADVTAIVQGKHVSLEIKHGNDKPRAAQLQVQTQVRAAGGIYEFVHTFEEFLKLMHGHGLIETTLFNTYFEEHGK